MRMRIVVSMMLMLVAGIAIAQEGKQPGRKTAPSYRTPPTHPDVKYGPYARNVMDVWLAKSDKPTPILVSIHGGGFSQGNKSVGPFLLEECLKSGISVVATPTPASPRRDARRQIPRLTGSHIRYRHNRHSRLVVLIGLTRWSLKPASFAAFLSLS